MWRTAELELSLIGMDGVGIRPVLRTGPPAPVDVAPMNRRREPRRRADLTVGRANLAARAGAAACQLLARLDVAVVLMHPNRGVEFANPAALRLAARGDCFRIRASRFQMADRHEQAWLEQFLDARASDKPALGGPRCARCHDESSRRYILHAEWLNAPLSGPRNLAWLRVYEPHRMERLSPEFLGRLYGLTRMEARLAASMFDYPALRAAAQHCGIGLNTAKTHLKQVFIKCGVTSKAQLLRVVALGPRSD